ncbi:uncharacterized protein PV07_08424 [Cladophialophora immunda]|uniref:Ipa protein n=1 Tax=Cladophialophora immunda TaxID=569365 RepID=A0A0D2C1Q3_9EURO|nr:uncharacterized protein PV07_08424 [Cladophialophora immunda]KIW25228.1 hypothetical protein PV07_08424 [Cladophialophora immunda]OQV00280.1 hypothetical protein CLAIMM_05798 [Cladophialophora immunda]
MSDSSTGDMVKDLHRDLVGKYNKHAAAVEQYWRSFDQGRRTQCIKAGAAGGVVLKHPLDRSLGNVYKIIPEINLRDITNPESDILLDLLKHRATTTLLDQYMTGLNGGPGDHAFIKQMMDTRNLHLDDPDPNGFTLFLDEDRYGQTMTIMREASQVRAGLAPAIRANLCVPQELGELILQRQLYVLQSLNIVIEDILDIGSRTRDRKKPSKKSDKAATTALSKLSIQEPAKSLSIPDLITSAADQKATLEEFLTLLSTEPVVLTHAVNLCFFSRPELLPDEKGRILPVHTDKYISGAVLEAVYNAIKAVAIWSYIGRLLDLLVSQPATDKTFRAIILQEISNVCHLEFSRAQALFKRNVQTATGVKWFKRMSNVYDKAGNARVTMKGDPESLTRTDPQLHYMLRLCQPESDALKATEWMKKLSDLHNAHPSEREKLEEREADSLGDLAVITSFVQVLSPSISMPSLSRKKNQMFVARSQELDAEMNELKSKIDLRDFVVPIDNLLEPRVASKTLTLLDHFIIENAGTKMGFLYQDLIEECLAEIERQYKLAKDRTEQKRPAEVEPTPPPVPEPREKRLEQRKQKEKTRPSHSSVFEIVATPEEEEPLEEEQPTIFKVRASTAEVFSTLFAKAESRGSVSWTAFVSAMTDLGFSVLPKTGSVYAFLPPENMHVSKSLTLHRPHKSEIEGYRAILYAKRLRKVYGWNERTFEVDE